jgi:hypothetical protein
MACFDTAQAEQHGRRARPYIALGNNDGAFATVAFATRDDDGMCAPRARVPDSVPTDTSLRHSA